ncbi:uncharacterized protein LOC116933188 [Daphnia magna]|uniref:uncharacterized protein LOC116933188 n=1 Tax=Daphnia magna TaxID=35525 RepID=UPI001E1BD10A|nr:uncharacterized protein LOC116933188 [Daphnia magna]
MPTEGVNGDPKSLPASQRRKMVDVGEPTILIGAGNQWLHLRLDDRLPTVGTDTPFGLLTPFGLTCVGDLTLGTQQHDLTVCRSNKPLMAVQKLRYLVQESPTEALLLRQVEKLWETESFLIITPTQPLESTEDKLARKKLDATIQFDGTRFEVGLPWVSEDIALPDNYNSALRRLFSIENKFVHNSNFAERYKAVIDDYVGKGFTRPFKESELKGTFGRNWYLPHHGAVNPRKPEKVRVVFDASAKYQGVALNEVLLKGSNLINDIGATLLLLREKPVSLSGDIQQMFLQVGVKKEDRSALRFLWRPPGSRKRPTVYEMQRQIFGSVSSPFICSQVLRHIADLHREEFPEAAERFYKNFYVDNLLDSFYTEEEANRAIKDSTALLKRGGFHLNQWLSSSRRVLSRVPEGDRNQPRLNLDLEDLPTERTLGVLYDSKNDSFIFYVKTDVEASTKRRILSAVSTLYDPLGFLSPVILSAKRILQELWLVGVDWDYQVPELIQHQWNKWTTNLSQPEAFKIPRALTSSSDIQDIQLHAFCDASTVGFGSVVYLQVVYRNKIVTVNFVTSKSRVAPLRPLTVPKLELQGAVVALRLWIASKTCRFQTFVANRISEILEHFLPTQWRHVSGMENPADECSRGLFTGKMMDNYRWVNGPAFLQQEEKAWPITIKLPGPSVEDPEVSATNWIGLVYGPAEENRIRSLLERNSNYDLVMRIVARVFRFISNSRLESSNRDNSRIGVKCIQRAANCFIKLAQLDTYSDEIEALKDKRPLKLSSTLITLSPFLDEQRILRVGGRLNYAPLSFDIKHPKILPHDHPLTRLIVMREHDPLFHPSTERRPSSIRSQYWIIKGRVAIKRAVHLEVAASLDLSSFLITFASFTARRSRPSVVYSDNGTQIVAGNKAIQQGIQRLKEQNIVGQMVKREIEWHFSPPLAPHFGGVWESLVKSAKVALEAIVESRPLTEELLRGFVIQAESLLNERPLTYVSMDPRDPEPLTPNHFLLVQSSPNTEDDVIEDEKLGHWPIGRVTRVIPSPDGVVRSVYVKTPTGEYYHPVSKLCLLESDVTDV